MKKLLGVALMLALCASSAFAGGGNRRTVGLSFGTWTPQGFVIAADTTFLSGAVVGTANLDTTGSFDLTDCDWGPSGQDLNINNFLLRVWAQGEFVSVDSIKVNVHQSFDNVTWFESGTFLAGGLQTMGTQQALSVPFSTFSTPYGIPGPSGNTLAPAPYARFVIQCDGNTAARMAATTVKVVYNSVRDNPSATQLTVKRVTWGSFSANGFNAEKDTSSIRFTAPDTTNRFSLSDWAPSASGFSAQVADSQVVMGMLGLVYSDPSTNDSTYVLQQTSGDGYHWTTPALNGANGLYGQYASAPGTMGSTIQDLGGNTYAGVGFLLGGSHNTLGNRPGGLGGAAFARFIVRASGSGQVMGGTKAWVTYFRAPSKR